LILARKDGFSIVSIYGSQPIYQLQKIYATSEMAPIIKNIILQTKHFQATIAFRKALIINIFHYCFITTIQNLNKINGLRKIVITLKIKNGYLI